MRGSISSLSLSLVALFALTYSCKESSAPAPESAAPAPSSSDAGVAGEGGSGGEAECAASPSTTVTFATDDGVKLAADLTVTGPRGGPAVVLLHMIPPSNSRSNYDATFIAKLTAKGMSVLNVDRRGAGESEGVAEDAYKGDKGKLDAKAAVAFLASHACAFDPRRIALVGASNGTTTVLDHATTAAVAPPSLVFLTGGSYTENQTKVDDQKARLAATPMLFVYSTAERAWSEGVRPLASSVWEFEEYDGGDHGTRMFERKPEAMDRVATFLAAHTGSAP